MSTTHPPPPALAAGADGSTAPRRVALADIAPNRRRGGDIRVLLDPATVGATSGFCGVLNLAPGESVNEHYHPYSEEFLYVVQGAIVVRLDGESTPAAAGEGVFVPIGVRHRVSNEGDEPAVATFHLAPLAPQPELGHVDTEPLPATLAERKQQAAPATLAERTQQTLPAP